MSQASKDRAGGSSGGWMGKAGQMMGKAQAKVTSSGGGKRVAKCALGPGSQSGKGCWARGREPGGSKEKFRG